MNVYDVYQAGLDGLREGRERGLAGLVGKAFNAPQGERQAALSKIAMVDGPAAFKTDEMMSQWDDRKQDALVRAAQMLLVTPEESRPQQWAQIVASGTIPGLKPVYDPIQVPEMARKIVAMAQAKGATPAGVQEFQFMSQGFSPEDSLKARRVALGLEGRASSAAIAYKLIKGGDGRERLVAVDPRTPGAMFIDTESGFGGAQPQGAPPQMQAPQAIPPLGQGGGDPFTSLHAAVPGLRVTSQHRTPEENARLPNSVPNSYHLTGQAIDLGRPTEEQKPRIRAWAEANGYEIIDKYNDGHWHLEPKPGMARQQQQGANPFVSRPEEQSAYLNEQAKQAAQLQFLPQQKAIETQAAIDQAGGSAEARALAEARAERESIAATKSVDADRTLMLLEQAKTLIPLSTGSGAGSLLDAGAAMFGRSTDGAKAIAALQTIAGQLTSSMPRMQGPQSDKDVQLYRQMAGDLANPNLPRETRMAALAQIEALNRKYANRGGARGQQGQQSADKPHQGEWGIRLKGSP